MTLLFLSVFLLLGDVGLFVNVFISLSPLNVGFYKLTLSCFFSLSIRTELLWLLVPVVPMKDPDASSSDITRPLGSPSSSSVDHFQLLLSSCLVTVFPIIVPIESSINFMQE